MGRGVSFALVDFHRAEEAFLPRDQEYVGTSWGALELQS
jgi:hypothetical protein